MVLVVRTNSRAYATVLGIRLSVCRRLYESQPLNGWTVVTCFLEK